MLSLVTDASHDRRGTSARDVTAKEVALLIMAAGRTTSLIQGEEYLFQMVATELLEGISYADQGLVARQAHSCYQL